MDTFELCVRENSWANPPIARLIMEDRQYEILGTGAGNPCNLDIDPTACYVLMLVMDHTETEYLISTQDYVPRQIQRGQRDDLLGMTFDQAAGHHDFEIGTKFYLTERLDRLILSERIRWDADGKPWISR